MRACGHVRQPQRRRPVPLVQSRQRLFMRGRPRCVGASAMRPRSCTSADTVFAAPPAATRFLLVGRASTELPGMTARNELSNPVSYPVERCASPLALCRILPSPLATPTAPSTHSQPRLLAVAHSWLVLISRSKPLPESVSPRPSPRPLRGTPHAHSRPGQTPYRSGSVQPRTGVNGTASPLAGFAPAGRRIRLSNHLDG